MLVLALALCGAPVLTLDAILTHVIRTASNEGARITSVLYSILMPPDTLRTHHRQRVTGRRFIRLCLNGE